MSLSDRWIFVKVTLSVFIVNAKKVSWRMQLSSKQKKAQFGLALNPDTSIEEVKKYLPYVDVILLMLIVPGFAGSSMIHGIMER